MTRDELRRRFPDIERIVVGGQDRARQEFLFPKYVAPDGVSEERVWDHYIDPVVFILGIRKWIEARSLRQAQLIFFSSPN